jgi:hypothetical protein
MQDQTGQFAYTQGLNFGSGECRGMIADFQLPIADFLGLSIDFKLAIGNWKSAI